MVTSPTSKQQPVVTNSSSSGGGGGMNRPGQGGSVSGSLINSDSEAYDYRYSGYNTSGATSSNITAN